VAIAAAFDLGRPTAPLTLVHNQVARSWRLDTTTGSFHVKEFWPDEDPFWAPQLIDRMDFERRALEAGIATVAPIPPVVPAYAWAGRVDGRGSYRVYEWIDNRHLSADDDVTDWLGTMLARLHELSPVTTPPELAWRWFVHHPRPTWEGWIAAGHEHAKSWASILQDNLDVILELCARDDKAFMSAADHVITHRDVEPYNVIISSSGPLLIDWDAVGPESATIETGHAAVTFGYNDTQRVHRILNAYTEAGGRLAPLGPDLLIRTANRQLSNITGLIRATLGERRPAAWMDQLDDGDRHITGWLNDLPGLLAHLDSMAASFAV
jgi:hypothetical protein